MSIWRIVANWILPVPLALFLLLSLPLPKNVRQGILLFVQRVFDLPVVGTFKLLHIMLWITALAFLGSVRQLQLLHQQQNEVVSWASPKAEISHLSKRWRAERNLWMGAFAFSSWVFLAAFYREAVRRLALESRLAEMERSDFTATETREREPSVSREVTSKAAAAAASRDRTPAGGSPAKPAAAGAAVAHPAAPQAAADRLAGVGGTVGAGTGIQMQEIKKDK